MRKNAGMIHRVTYSYLKSEHNMNIKLHKSKTRYIFLLVFGGFKMGKATPRNSLPKKVFTVIFAFKDKCCKKPIFHMGVSGN